MPGSGDTDPADVMAQSRREAGFSRQLQKDKRIALHPRMEGSPSYAIRYRAQQLDKYQNGEPVDVSMSSIHR